MYADGASRGNPGPSSYGVVIESSEGECIEELREAIGFATNNVAEYSGLIAGLQRATELKAEILQVYLDSELIVKQIKGLYRVKNEGLKPFYQKAIALKKEFSKFSIDHVPRAKNAYADALANEALDLEG